MNITVVTACWRSENIPKVIEMLDNQTYKNFHHVLVNDNNPEVRDTFKKLCNGVNRHWVDLGVRTHYWGAIARNIGVQVAFSYIHSDKRDVENEWVCFFDDDNKWEPNHLQTIVDSINNNPQATMVATDAVWFGANNESWREVRECRIARNKCDLGQFAYRTTLFQKYGYFLPRPRRKQLYDWELIQKMAEGEGIDKIVFTHNPTFLLSYRKR